MEDSLNWKHTQNGLLSFKDAFLFKSSKGQKIQWAKTIWSPDIPPSKSILIWRILHNRMPTNENLITRGCQLASMCSICLKEHESTLHLFFLCPFARKIWVWLATILNTSLQFNSFEDIWKICNQHWSPQCQVVIKASFLNIFSSIWYTRNQARFQNKQLNWRSVINTIISNVTLSGNKTCKTSSSSMFEFMILKAFNIIIHPPKAPTIKEVLWQPPLSNWTKVNTDGVLVKNPMKAACGGIFRDNNASFKGGFAQNTETGSSYSAELLVAILAIEIAYSKNWHNLWLETDSQLVLLAFRSKTLIPCELRNRWINCLELVKQMNFFVSHIYREGNSCADGFASLGLALSSFVWFPSLPADIRHDYYRTGLGLPNFRFSY